LERPSITIQTYLGRIADKDIKTVRQQLSGIVTSDQTREVEKATKAVNYYKMSMGQLTTAYEMGNRASVIGAVRARIARHEINSASEAIKAFKIILRDSFTAAGMMNNALSIMTSRFGTMLIIFGAVQKIQTWAREMKDAALVVDTAMRRVAASVISESGNMQKSYQALLVKGAMFATQYGVTLEQISQSMFHLASAGRTDVQIMQEIDAAQRLVIATSRDMTSSMKDNQDTIEIFAGLMNIYSDATWDAAQRNKFATKVSSDLYVAWKRQQILMPELTAGLSYSASQAKLAGISIQELVASLAVLNTGLVKGSKAGTSYANAVRDTIVNAEKLNKLLGIDVSKIGTEGFSLFETVIKRVSAEIKHNGLTLTTFQKLFEIYNIRATRAILSLAVQSERVSQQLEDFKDSEVALNSAIEIINNSLQSQQNITTNLKQMHRAMWMTAITGGRGYEAIIKRNNTMAAIQLKVMSAAIIPLMILIGAMVTVGEAVLAFIIEILHLIRVLKLLNSEQARTNLGFGNMWKNLKKGVSSVKAFWAFFKGDVGLTESLTNLQTALNDTADGFDEVDSLVKQYTDSLDAYGKALNANIKIMTRFNRELLYPVHENLLSEFGKEIERVGKDMFEEGIAKPFITQFDRERPRMVVELSRFNKDVADGLKMIQASNNAEDFSKRVVDSIKFIEVNGTESITVMREQMRNEVEKLYADFLDKFESLATAPEDSVRDLLNNLSTIFSTYGAGILSEEEKLLDKSVEAFSNAQERRLDALDRFFRLRDVMVNKQKAIDYTGGLRDIKSVEFLPKAASAATKQLADTQTKIVSDAELIVTEMLRRNLSLRVGMSSTFGGRIIDVNRATSDQIIKMWGNVSERTARLTKEQQNVIENVAKQNYKLVEKAISSQFESQRKDAEKVRNAYVEEILRTQQEIDRIRAIAAKEGRKPREAEITHIESLEAKKVELEIKGYEKYISLLRDVDKAIEDQTKDAITNIQEIIKTRMDAITSSIDESQAHLELMLERFEEKMALARSSLGSAADIIVNISEIFGSTESNMYRVAKSIEAVTSGVASGIEIWTNYQRSVKNTSYAMKLTNSQIIDSNMKFHAFFGNILDVAGAMRMMEDRAVASAAKLNMMLGVFSVITTVISAIIGLMKSEDEQRTQLEQEFLDKQKARSLSPDYGQARITNNRIVMQTNFDFIDPSQLSPQRKREIALWLYEEFAEIVRTRG
jgi:tetratricopeptide (TPR) repeat protein/DNA-binding ferritin-like protein (Dps family)